MVEKGFWIFISLFFGLLLSQGSWPLAAAILGLLLYASSFDSWITTPGNITVSWSRNFFRFFK